MNSMLQISDIQTPYIANFSDFEFLKAGTRCVQTKVYSSVLCKTAYFSVYRRFHTIQHPREQTGAGLRIFSIIKQYLYWSEILTGNFVMAPILGLQNSIWMYYSCWFKGIKVLLCFFMESLQCLPGIPNGQGIVDKDSS